MGGLLALALGARRPRAGSRRGAARHAVGFHAERAAQARLLGSLAATASAWPARACATVPVDVLQACFTALDPFLAVRKFVRFAGIARQATAARGFRRASRIGSMTACRCALPVAQRMPAAAGMATNTPARGRGAIAGAPVLPQEIAARPALVVVPGRDRIVPPGSARALAARCCRRPSGSRRRSAISA